MATLDIGELSSGDDADITQTSASFNSNRNYIYLLRHATTTDATVGAFRFKIPSSIKASDITTVTLRLTAVSANTMYGSVLAERTPADVTWSNTSPNRPTDRYAAAVSAGSVAQSWNIASTTSSGTVYVSPDLSADIKVAMVDGGYVSGSSYVGILWKGDIGSPNGVQFASFDHTTVGYRPTLRITYTDTTYSQIVATGINYSDGTGVATGRVCDIYVPAGTPKDPSVGLPCVIWLHGGFWRTGMGSKADLPAGFANFVQEKGYVFVNAEYNAVQSDILFSNTGSSFPYPIQDVRTLIKFLYNNKDTYRIDPNNIIITGNSAGGNVALWAACSLGDSNNYSGYQNSNSNRANDSVNTRPAFDLDRNLTTNQSIRGCFVWVAPVDIWEITQHPNGFQAIANNIGRTGYMGEKQGTNPGSGYDELDLNKYISGTSNTYGTTKHEPAIPIGYVEALSDTIVTVSAGVNSLYNSLGTSGFSYSRPGIGTITSTGLTRLQVSTSHENAMLSSEGWQYFGRWLDAVVGADPIWKPQVTVT